MSPQKMNNMIQHTLNNPQSSNLEEALIPHEVLSHELESHVQLDLPLGCRFVPTDKELIIYLDKMINNKPLPHGHIPVVNVHKYNPRELAVAYPILGRDEWYFFTTRDRKYLNGSRPDRTAGDGYWKATMADTKIYHNNECVGFKKTLVFYEGKPPKAKKTNWIMHEYIANQPPTQPRGTNGMLLDNHVLCRIHEIKRSAAPESPDLTRHSSFFDTIFIPLVLFSLLAFVDVFIAVVVLVVL